MHEQMERLYQAAKVLKKIESQAEVARALNQSSQTVNNWEARGISKAGLLKAQATLGCSATWLETGVGPMVVEPAQELDFGLPAGSYLTVNTPEVGNSALVQIPKVTLRLSAGISGFEVEPERFDGASTTVPLEFIQRNGYNREHLIAIRVRGESMETSLYEGDLVIINTADKKPVDGEVFAVNYEGEPVVKRMERDAGDWWLKSDNPDQRKFSRKICRGDACIIIGKVVRKESERI